MPNFHRRTLAEVHRVIRQSQSEDDAATKLGIQVKELIKYLSRVVQEGRALTYAYLREVSLENGPQVFRERYTLPMTARRVDLNGFTLAVLHETIHDTKNSSDTASRLGILNTTLSHHLGRFMHKGQPLTYAFLKAIPLSQGPAEFGERYPLPMRQVAVHAPGFNVDSNFRLPFFKHAAGSVAGPAAEPEIPIPEIFNWATSGHTMKEPVLCTLDGNTYERKEISTWLGKMGCPPAERSEDPEAKVAEPVLIPNRAERSRYLPAKTIEQVLIPNRSLIGIIEEKKTNQDLKSFRCCISLETPKKVVLCTLDGYSYEESLILKWLKEKGASPMNRVKMHQSNPQEYVVLNKP